MFQLSHRCGTPRASGFPTTERGGGSLADLPLHVGTENDLMGSTYADCDKLCPPLVHYPLQPRIKTADNSLFCFIAVCVHPLLRDLCYDAYKSQRRRTAGPRPTNSEDDFNIDVSWAHSLIISWVLGNYRLPQPRIPPLDNNLRFFSRALDTKK